MISTVAQVELPAARASPDDFVAFGCLQQRFHPQMALDASTTSASFASTSSSETLFPSECDANPHCGLMQILRQRATSKRAPDTHTQNQWLERGRGHSDQTHWPSASSFVRFSAPSAITSAAARTFCFSTPTSSSCGSLLEIRPRTSVLPLGKNLRGSNVPARAVSYSSCGVCAARARQRRRFCQN